jgi:ABC-type multidrug transport system ATPase subunit
MTYRENTFGIASIINLVYKKSFFEVLFFTNKDVLEKGVPLLKIYTPIEEQIDFDEIIVEPDFDDDGLVSPVKIIGRMRKLIRREFQKHLTLLDKEVELLDEIYENLPIDNIPYHREIGIYFPDFVVKLNINFEKFPTIPSFSFSKTLSRIVSEREFNESDIITDWNELNPPHIYELVEKLTQIITDRLKVEPIKYSSQHLVVVNFSIGGSIKDISFKIHRGKSIGIVYDKELFENAEHSLTLLKLFEAISGEDPNFSGRIEIFGRYVQLLPTYEMERIFILPQAYESKITKMKLKKAIQYGIDIKGSLKERKVALDKVLKNAGLTSKMGDLVSDFLVGAPLLQITRKREFIKNSLTATGLWNKKKKRFSQLTPLEFLLFSIGRALLQSPTIVMFSIPFGLLNRIDFEKFNKYMNRIKEVFHIILIFHGPEGIASKCDQILTVSQSVSKIGTHEDYINALPYAGEYITVEFNNADENLIKKINEFEEVNRLIEERKNEKYKIYIKENPDKLIIKLTELFGANLFSFKISKASIGDYLEFNQ